MIACRYSKIVGRLRFFDGSEYLYDQKRMMGNDYSSRFGNNMRKRYRFFIADIHDIIDTIGAVFFESIIRRGMEDGAAPIVIDSEPAADIEIIQFFEAHFLELCKVPGRFAGCFF